MTDGLDDLDAEERRREQATKPPDSLISRIREPPRGALTRSAPRRTFLVEQVDGGERRGIIGRGHVHLLAGEGGAGKGRWILSVAAAIAAGEPCAEDGRNVTVTSAPETGRLSAKRGGMSNVCGLEVNGIREDEKVLLILGEDDEIDFHQRCEGVAEALNIKADMYEKRFIERCRWLPAHGIPFAIIETSRVRGDVVVDVSPMFRGLVEWIKANGPWGMIVLDPYARFAGVDDNDNALNHKVFTHIETLTLVNGEGWEPPAVVVVDHTRKPDAGEDTPSQHWIRGGSSKVNAVRAAMVMVPGGKRVVVDSEGRRKGEEGFDESAATEIGEGEVAWYHVKSNGERKADPVALHFTTRGGLTAETETARRERRKRQWKAAEKRGEVRRPRQDKGRASGKRKADDDVRVDAEGDA